MASHRDFFRELFKSKRRRFEVLTYYLLTFVFIAGIIIKHVELQVILIYLRKEIK